jgi:DNA-binding transcriptional regulator YiaG
MSEDIDTTTAEGFKAGMDRLRIGFERVARLMNVDGRSVKRWCSGAQPVHPTAAAMLRWLLDGYRPYDWPQTGDQFRAHRESLGISADALAQLLDVETEILLKWESDERGPPDLAARALGWLLDGHRPSGFPKACRGASPK